MVTRAEAEQLARTVPVLPYYAGRWGTDSSEAAFEVIDPVTERRLVSVAEAGPAEVDRAVCFARSAVAVNGWSPLDPRLPWGGSGLSGHGRELGWPAIEANTEEKDGHRCAVTAR